jgi:tRNA threonylcarbamoyl adenosine modification protein (Sua5/YciO/YrdC/YwlC family)
MLIHIHPDNPQERGIRTIVDCLRSGGVIIYPTDTIYGLGCNIFDARAIERICRIKGIDPKKAQLSFVCSDLKHLSDFSKTISTPVFRILKNALPGPYTFILEAGKQVPKLLKSKKDTVGIRVPDHAITQAIVTELGHPIMSVSLPNDEDAEYYTDPESIYEKFGKLVDMVVDGGHGNVMPSTVIDCTSGVPVLIREGAGDWTEIIR